MLKIAILINEFSILMRSGTITDATIKRLVDDFYLRVRRDPDLGPVFEAAIGDSDTQWRPHLEKMYDFWSSVMLTSGRYHGNPLQKHKELPAFEPRLFNRWLELFAQAAQELHAPSIAAIYLAKSRRIAESLKQGLYYNPDNLSGARAERRE